MLFFDAFPTLETETELKNVFSKAEVSSVTALPDKDDVIVNALSKKYITGLQIERMEKALFTSVFSKAERLVTLKVKFEFDDNTGFEAMWDKYRLYMPEEIGTKSGLLASLYRNARVSGEDGVITIDMEDSFIAHERQGHLASVIIDYWKDRFGIDVKVDFKYHEIERRDTSGRDEIIRVIKEKEIYESKENRNDTADYPGSEDDWFNDLEPDIEDENDRDQIASDHVSNAEEMPGETEKKEAEVPQTAKEEPAAARKKQSKASKDEKTKGTYGKRSKRKNEKEQQVDPDIFYGRNSRYGH